MPAPKIAGTIRSKNPLKGAVEVLPERLYYAALRQPPPSHNILASTPKRDDKTAAAAAAAAGVPKEKKQIHFFNVDNELVYWNFFLDFGPLNLGQMVRFCYKLNDKMRKFPVVCFYSSTLPAKRTNATFLIGAWQMLFLKRSPEQALAGFQPDAPTGPVSSLPKDCSWPPVSQNQGAPTIAPTPPFHDASPVACTFDLSVLDCLRGMAKAIEHKFWDLETFDVEEYEHFEQVENGDLNWIMKDRILAFAGPSYTRHVSPEGYCTLSPDDYSPYFQRKGVDLVVRLNRKNYHEEDFVNNGIRHVEHFFVDGSCPPMKILHAVLDDFERVPRHKAFAVHCKAGLGRTGTCIGAYIMKHYKFTAREVIGWMRLCRPGSVIGPQQQFLQQIEKRMWQAGGSLPSPTTSSHLSGSVATGTFADAPVSPRTVLDRDAVTGRQGQADGLLAARNARGRPILPTPPITPDTRERESTSTVVTPDSNSANQVCGW